jgi:UDP-N-acetylmuramoylalanine--D-glutamate ligase
VGGNIGIAFAQIVDGMDKDSTAVLEVSSFQLDEIQTFRPRVSVILNITPDHLDRYGGSFERYIDSKCRVFMNQRTGDSVVYNYDDPAVRSNVEARVHEGVRRLPFSTESQLGSGAFIRQGNVQTIIDGNASSVISVDQIRLRGKHNLYNVMAATLSAQAMGIPVESLRATLSSFQGVEHRLEFVRELAGVTYVNDSKATNVESVWYALQSFTSPIVLLLGGRDKGNDYERLYPLVQASVRAIVAIGESAGKVMDAFKEMTTVRRADSMQEAVQIAATMAHPGDVVLLSPACASFDWFKDYEHRGRVFKNIVQAL